MVWYLARGQALEDGKRIPAATLDASLKEKYGPPSYAPYGDMTWEYDQKNVLYRGDSARGPCTGYAGNTRAFVQAPGFMINVPSSFGERCGTYINYHPSVRGNDGMASGFVVTIADMRRMYNELNAKAMSEEAERKKQLDGGKVNKPKL